ncbi:MAG: peroxiredoxin [Phycisphaerales bacterium]
MLSIGATAPDFTLPDQDGTPFQLDAETAAGPLVLFFYPADFTPVCTKEACMFRDAHAELATAGVRVVGVSPQDSESHRRFREAFSLPYRLLSDTKREVISTYAGSVAGISLPFVTRRVTYVIGKGRAVLERVVADLNAEAHRRVIKAATSSQPRPG